jgi:signal transduction histidine kinase
MRRRLTVAVTGLVAAALALAGFGGLVVTRRAARSDAVSQVLAQAQQVARVLAEPGDRRLLAPSGAGTSSLSNEQLRVLAERFVLQIVHANHAAIVRLDASGTLQSAPPPGVSLADLQPSELAAGNDVSGYDNNLAFAAAPFALSGVSPARAVNARAVVILTRDLGNLGPSWAYFLLVGGITLLLAVVVAATLSRRITRPLLSAVSTTGRIARGDLEARVEVGPGDYPELVSLAESIDTMAESLARAKGLERQFLMSVSHDLRTPLTSIRGYAEALTDGTARDTVRAGTVIASEAGRLERLVRDLLDLANLDARRFSLDIRPTNGAEVISNSTEGFRPMLDKAGLALSLSLPPGEPLWVSADPVRLAQVLANLMENAFNYALRSVAVTARRHDGSVLVAVEDDGPGIADEDVDHVFERLYQSSRTPARQAGSGLGLAIVSELVAAMGGTVRAESPTMATGGTRMVVTLKPSIPAGVRDEAAVS